VLFALVLPVGLLGRQFTTLFTARRRFELVSSADIVGTVLGAVVFILAAWRFGIWGGLIAAISVYPLGFLIGAWMGRGHATTRLLSFWPHAERSFVRPILRFYPMLLVNSAALPLATILVRAILMDEFGAAQAGLWQATVRLSDTYTLVFLTTLGMYSLPTLSASRSETEFASALRRMVFLSAGSMVVTIVGLYVCRDLIIRILFTGEFAPVRDLWPWRLMGDLFLIAGRPMMNALVARGRGTAYIALEVGAGVGMWGLTVALLESQALAAANVAHALVWACSFVCLTVLHRRELFVSR
jgi:PST family polysaccharide transporter